MADLYNNENVNVAEDLPWLIFTLDDKAYAVNSKFVNGIEMKPKVVTPIPEAPEAYCGVVQRRGEVYPLLDMRKVFHFSTLDEEAADFRTMMEQRKADHVKWVETLEHCAETGEAFTLATDSHKCALGLWYDEFTKNHQSAAVLLKKIEEPHRKLHDAAHAVLEAADKGDKETVAKLIRRVRTDYMPKVIAAIDDAENAYKTTFKETVVVLTEGDQMLGLLVDKVLAVDKISFINGGGSMNLLLQSKYFCNVARCARFDMEILVIDERELLTLSDVDTTGVELPE